MSVSASLENAAQTHTPHVRPADLFDIAVFFAAAAYLIWQAWTLDRDRPEMWQIIALLSVNGAIAIVGLMISLRRRYPIFLACFYFDYFFLAIAPIQQIRAEFDPIFGHDATLLTTVTLCLMYTAIAVTALFVRMRPVRPRAAGVDSNTISFFLRSSFDARFYPFALFFVVATITCALIAIYGSAPLSNRDENATLLLQQFDGPVFLLFTGYLNSLIFVGSVLGLVGALTSRNWTWVIVFLVLLAATEYVSNPFATARFRASALILFAMLALFGWNNTRLLAIFLLGGLGISPILNLFRNDSMTELEVRSLDSFFVHMDYDAFAMANYIVHYVEQTGYSYGYNILSAFFFFVPRAIWSGKAENIAALVWPQVRYYRNVWTPNLSSPIFAEGFYAFGMIGAAVLMAAVFAAFVTLERRAQAAQPNAPARFLVCLSPMLVLILLRGAFVVGYSEFCGNIAALLTALALLRVKITIARL